MEGVCTLVDVDAGERQTTLYFVTSAQPFRTMDGEPYRSPAQRILITLDDDEVIAVPREGVLLPLGSLVDVAILRVDVTMARPHGTRSASMRRLLVVDSRLADVMKMAWRWA